MSGELETAYKLPCLKYTSPANPVRNFCVQKLVAPPCVKINWVIFIITEVLNFPCLNFEDAEQEREREQVLNIKSKKAPPKKVLLQRGLINKNLQPWETSCLTSINVLKYIGFFFVCNFSLFFFFYVFYHVTQKQVFRSFLWHWLSTCNLYPSHIIWHSRCDIKRRMGRALPANFSYVMTSTKILRFTTRNKFPGKAPHFLSKIFS